MALISFKDWRLSVSEGSATSRARAAWARYGNYPLSAGFTSGPSPDPFTAEKLKKALGKKKKKKKNK